MNIPSNLKYTKDHEWISIDGDIATVGITDFAQGELGDIVPLSGEIIEFNDSLEIEPEKVNSDAFGEGWMIKIKISNPDEINELLDHEAYKKIVGL